MPKSWFEPLFSRHISEPQLNSWTRAAIVELISRISIYKRFGG